MATKAIPLTFKDKTVEVEIGSTIKREELYGKTRKTIEKDGVVLEKVTLSPEGEIFRPSDFTHLRMDGEGCLVETPVTQTEEGQKLEIQTSSFKTERPLKEASVSDLAALKIESVIPAITDLPVGIYATQYTFRDSPTLHSAILNVTPAGAFLLVGETLETPFQGKADTYDFFGTDEDEEDAEDEISFDMF